MKIRSVFLVLLLALTLTACGGSNDEPAAPAPEPSLTLALRATLLDDEEEAKENSVYIMDSEGENASVVSFSPNEDVGELAYVSVASTVSDDGVLECEPDEVIEFIGNIAADETLTFRLTLPELIPDRGFTLTDKNGASRFFILLDSGENGMPFLTEYLLLDE